MAKFIKFPSYVETEHGHVIDWLNLDTVIGFRLGQDDGHNIVDVYLVNGDSFRAWKEDTDPFRSLTEKQHP
jgi:hypothetical protein